MISSQLLHLLVNHQTNNMKLKLFVVLELILVVVSSATSDKDFSFDHAFRNFEDFVVSSNDQMTLEAREAPAGLVVDNIDRMGVAAADDRMQQGAEELPAEDMANFDDFLRKISEFSISIVLNAFKLNSQFNANV